MKKILSLLVSMILVSMMFVPVFGATDINANEQKVVDRFAQGVTLSSGSAKPTAAQVNVIKNFLMMDGVNLTAADASAIIAAMDKINTVTKTVASLSDLTTAQKTSIINMAQDGAVAVAGLGLYVTYDSVNNVAYLSGNAGLMASLNYGPVVKQTGFDMGTTYVVLSGLVLAMGGALLLTKKYNLLASKA